MTNLDRFAAQIASLDAVISTSSTVVHLAGALGIPSVVILEESLLTWPLFSNRVPWYPRTILVHRHWRDWPTVMKEAQSELDSLLAVR
jgi:ADP-heptose:LPS heptosyltransferase